MKFKDLFETLQTFNKEHNISEHIEIDIMLDNKYVDISCISMNTTVEYETNVTKRKYTIKFKSKS